MAALASRLGGGLEQYGYGYRGGGGGALMPPPPDCRPAQWPALAGVANAGAPGGMGPPLQRSQLTPLPAQFYQPRAATHQQPQRLRP
jgi:hypothetical protein